jgi:hypothetical protein
MPFQLDTFVRNLIVETLFYDEEYQAIGTISLVEGGQDDTDGRERYVAAYVPEEGAFVIEEATEWEDDEDGDDDIGYALATDTDEYGSYDTPEEAATELLKLAKQHDLSPSVTLLFEDDDAA